MADTYKEAKEAILKAVAAAKERVASAPCEETPEDTQKAASEAALQALKTFARGWWCYRDARWLLRYGLSNLDLHREDAALIDSLIRQV